MPRAAEDAVESALKARRFEEIGGGDGFKAFRPGSEGREIFVYNAPLPGPRRSPDSQRQSGYALLPSCIRRQFLIQIDARLSPCSSRRTPAATDSWSILRRISEGAASAIVGLVWVM